MGAFHCGVEIFGEEFSFGGHEHSFSGIFVKKPRVISNPNSTIAYRFGILFPKNTEQRP